MVDPFPRRILMTADTIGGVWNFALELCRALAAHDIEILLATMGRPLRADQTAALAALPHVNCCESDYRLEWMDDPWTDVERAGSWLLALERDFRPDVVHLNGYVHGALPWRAAVLVVGHSCVLSWWRAVRGVPAPPVWERYRALVRAGLHAADAVAAPSAAMLASLHAHYGRLPNPQILPNGRAAEDFPPRPKESFVLSVGRFWDDAKNLAALLAAAPSLSWPVRLAGETANAVLPAFPANVTSLGPLAPPELAELYGRASIYALPARYEPFGLSVLEAALAGCALVLGDIPSLREIWGDAARFVPPEDHVALASAINELAADPGTRRSLAARARARAAGLTPRRMAAGYLSAYATAAHASAAPFSACA